MIIFVGGPSGTGKSTIGAQLCLKLGPEYTFIEGDDLHPQANKDKMASGVGLTDLDRWPWLGILAKTANGVSNGNVIVTCSMLKLKYRDFLRREIPHVHLVVLSNDFETIYNRMKARQNHFFKADMLESQYRDFESPQLGEHDVTVIQCGERTSQDIIDEIYKIIKTD